MARAVEWYLLVTSLVIGLSHVLQPAAWAEAYAALHRAGRPGAFINGALALATGAMVVGFHPVWSGPPLVLTVFGCILVLKGAVPAAASAPWPSGLRGGDSSPAGSCSSPSGPASGP